MFCEIDNIIFPNSCEVIQVTSQHYVFPIFKCGRSSLVQTMEEKGWTFVPTDEISNIEYPVTVFLREPRDRFLSGVNTYLQHLESEGNDLDQHTVLYFVNRYLFLNRHYAPQFFWMLNLARYAPADVLINFQNMENIKQLTHRHSHAEVLALTDSLKSKIDSFDWSKLELYFYLDNILLGYIGQTVPLSKVIADIQQHTDLYELVFNNSLDIVNVLPKT